MKFQPAIQKVIVMMRIPQSRLAALRRQSRIGAAIVEVAVCFPVFLMILLGIIEFGRAMSINQLLNSSARVGCRVAILDGSSNTSVSNAVKSHVATTVGCSQSDVTVTITCTSSTSGATISDVSAAKTGDVIIVKITVPFSKVSWAVAKYLPTKSVNGMCSMQHE
jgi:Flp pilus assembly protein TadG